MANLLSLTLTSGAVGNSGTISTLDNVIGPAGTPNTNVQTVQGIASMTPVQVSQATAASLNATVVGTGTFAVQATLQASATTAIGTVNPNTISTWGIAVIGAGTAPTNMQVAGGVYNSSAPTLSTGNSAALQLTATGSLHTTIDNANSNGRKTPSNSAPVVLASQAYNTVAASQTAQALTGGSGGAVGDWLDFVLIIPGTTAAGAVSITDGSGSAITIWAGGGTTALVSLVPFAVPIRAVSTSGAWKITTATNVTAIASGNFT